MLGVFLLFDRTLLALGCALPRLRTRRNHIFLVCWSLFFPLPLSKTRVPSGGLLIFHARNVAFLVGLALLLGPTKARKSRSRIARQSHGA